MAEHETVVNEVGGIMRATCSCGWVSNHPHPDGSAEFAARAHAMRYATSEGRDHESEQALMDVIDEFEMLSCTRVWSAWGYGTMTEDDFEPAPSEDLVEAIVAAGWRPPSKEVSTVNELEMLPFRTIVVDEGGKTYRNSDWGGHCLWSTVDDESAKMTSQQLFREHGPEFTVVFTATSR